jgi:hypothetical protein
MSDKKFGGITVEGVPVKEEKHRGTQILFALALGVLFVGPWLVVLLFHRHLPAGCNRHDCSTHVSVAAVAAVVVLDVLLLIWIARRAVRTWQW